MKQCMMPFVDGHEWSTPRRFRCSHNWEQMLDNVRKHLSFTFLLAFFSCGALLQYLVYLVLTIIVSFSLVNHNNRVNTSACIHDISVATFAIVAKNNLRRNESMLFYISQQTIKIIIYFGLRGNYLFVIGHLSDSPQSRLFGIFL